MDSRHNPSAYPHYTYPFPPPPWGLPPPTRPGPAPTTDLPVDAADPPALFHCYGFFPLYLIPVPISYHQLLLHDSRYFASPVEIRPAPATPAEPLPFAPPSPPRSASPARSPPSQAAPAQPDPAHPPAPAQPTPRPSHSSSPTTGPAGPTGPPFSAGDPSGGSDGSGRLATEQNTDTPSRASMTTPRPTTSGEPSHPPDHSRGRNRAQARAHVRAQPNRDSAPAAMATTPATGSAAASKRPTAAGVGAAAPASAEPQPHPTSLPSSPNHFSSGGDRSPGLVNSHSPRSAYSDTNAATPSLRPLPQRQGGCQFETAQSVAKRRFQYSVGGDQLDRVDLKVLKPKLSAEEDQVLTAALYDLYRKLLPTPGVEANRRRLIQKLERIFNEAWPGHDIRAHLFGSSGSLLCSDDSDVDICITTPWREMENVCMIAHLLAKRGMEKVVCISAAKVPIVKIWDPELQLACDMNVNNTVALENTRMIRTYMQIDARIRPLAMIIKHWTRRRVINDAAFGFTLSSYTWICMIIAFLQQRRPAIVPALHQYDAAKRVLRNGELAEFADDLRKLRGYSSRNECSIGQLLFQFFRFYGHEFEYDGYVLSIRRGILLTKASKNWLYTPNNRLCVEEPFNTGRNLANTADDFSFRGLHLELRRAYDLISDTRLAKCCEQYVWPKEEERVFVRQAQVPRPAMIRSSSTAQPGMAAAGRAGPSAGRGGGPRPGRGGGGANGTRNGTGGRGPITISGAIAGGNGGGSSISSTSSTSSSGSGGSGGNSAWPRSAHMAYDSQAAASNAAAASQVAGAQAEAFGGQQPPPMMAPAFVGMDWYNPHHNNGSQPYHFVQQDLAAAFMNHHLESSHALSVANQHRPRQQHQQPQQNHQLQQHLQQQQQQHMMHLQQLHQQQLLLQQQQQFQQQQHRQGASSSTPDRSRTSSADRAAAGPAPMPIQPNLGQMYQIYPAYPGMVSFQAISAAAAATAVATAGSGGGAPGGAAEYRSPPVAMPETCSASAAASSAHGSQSQPQSATVAHPATHSTNPGGIPGQAHHPVLFANLPHPMHYPANYGQPAHFGYPQMAQRHANGVALPSFMPEETDGEDTPTAPPRLPAAATQQAWMSEALLRRAGINLDDNPLAAYSASARSSPTDTSHTSAQNGRPIAFGDVGQPTLPTVAATAQGQTSSPRRSADQFPQALLDRRIQRSSRSPSPPSPVTASPSSGLGIDQAPAGAAAPNLPSASHSGQVNDAASVSSSTPLVLSPTSPMAIPTPLGGHGVAASTDPAECQPVVDAVHTPHPHQPIVLGSNLAMMFAQDDGPPVIVDGSTGALPALSYPPQERFLGTPTHRERMHQYAFAQRQALIDADPPPFPVTQFEGTQFQGTPTHRERMHQYAFAQQQALIDADPSPFQGSQSLGTPTHRERMFQYALAQQQALSDAEPSQFQGTQSQGTPTHRERMHLYALAQQKARSDADPSQPAFQWGGEPVAQGGAVPTYTQQQPDRSLGMMMPYDFSESQWEPPPPQQQQQQQALSPVIEHREPPDLRPVTPSQPTTPPASQHQGDQSIQTTPTPTQPTPTAGGSLLDSVNGPVIVDGSNNHRAAAVDSNAWQRASNNRRKNRSSGQASSSEPRRQQQQQSSASTRQADLDRKGG